MSGSPRRLLRRRHELPPLRSPLSYRPLCVILLSCVGLVKTNESQPGPTPSPSPSPVVQAQQMLYVVSHGSVATYTVDPKTLTAQAVGAPVNLVQISAT
jgi:hypothetical protein